MWGEAHVAPGDDSLEVAHAVVVGPELEPARPRLADRHRQRADRHPLPAILHLDPAIAQFGAGRIGQIHAANIAARRDSRLKYLIDTNTKAAGALAALRPAVAAYAAAHWSWERCTRRYAEILQAWAPR